MTQPPPQIAKIDSDPKRSIILIGSSVRAAAQDARRAGYLVIAIDRFGDVDLLSRCDHWCLYDETMTLPKIAEIGGLVPVVPVGGFHGTATNGSQPLIAYPPEETLRAISCPRRLHAIAKSHGVLFPETWTDEGRCLVPGTDHRSDRIAPNRWLIKPKDHAGGVGIRQILEGEDFPATHYRQRKIRGRAIGVNFISVATPQGVRASMLGAFVGITYRRHPDHRFLYGGSLGPIGLNDSITQRLRQLGQSIAESFLLRGLFNVDLIVSPDETLWLLEINPRYSASMELISDQWNISLIDLHLACYENRQGVQAHVDDLFRVQLTDRSQTVSVKRIVYANRSVTIQKELETIFVGDHRIRLSDIPAVGSSIGKGEPICTVVAHDSRSCAQALQTSATAAKLVRSAAG